MSVPNFVYWPHIVSAIVAVYLLIFFIAQRKTHDVHVSVGFIEAGGFEAVMHQFMSAFPNTTVIHRLHGANDSYSSCGIPPDNSLHFIRSADDSRLPWPGVFIGLTIASIWYWCTDQVCLAYSLCCCCLLLLVTPGSCWLLKQNWRCILFLLFIASLL